MEAIQFRLTPSLFGYEALPQWLTEIVGLPVKKGGMGLRNPAMWGEESFNTSVACTTHLRSSLLGERTAFSLVDHDAAMTAGKRERETRVGLKCNEIFENAVSSLDCGKERALRRGAQTGGWLTAIPRARDETLLSSTEFRDGLALHYRNTPLHLPSHCDGCGRRANLDHAINCHFGGNVIVRHNEIQDAVGAIASLAFSSSSVRTEPRIQTGCRAEESRDKDSVGESTEATEMDEDIPASNFGNNDRGDLRIRGLWQRQTDCILDIRVTDTDLRSQRNQDPMKVLANHESLKKDKYL